MRVCAHPSCKETISNKMLMCIRHWCLVPTSIKDRMRALYRPGQDDSNVEIDMEWVKAAREAVTESYKRDREAEAVPVLRGLTLWQPWGWAIVAEHKPVENRPWKLPPHLANTPICIHGGKVYDKEGDRDIRDLLGLAGLPPQAHDQGILGVVWFGESTELEKLPVDDARLDVPWFSGPHGWWVREVVALPEPVPCKGMLGAWPIPAEIAKTVWYRVCEARALKS